MCLPRPDSPSLFGALLDRSAGFFRFGPSNTIGPRPAPLRPGHHGARDDVAHADGLADGRTTCSWSGPPRTTSGWRATSGCPATRPAGHAAAHRDVLQRPGRGASQLPAAVRLRTHRRRVELRRHRVRPPPSSSTATCRSDDGEQPPARHRSASAPYGRTTLQRGRVGVRRAVVGRDAARRRSTKRSEQLHARRERFWRDWLSTADVPRPPVPPVHRAQRARAQGAELRADRRDHGRGDDVAARDARRRAQLGLPLHVDPRHRVHAARAARSRLRLGGVRVLRVHPRRVARLAPRTPADGFDLQIMYGIGGETDLTEHTLDHLAGLRRTRARSASATARTTSSSTTCGGCSSTSVGSNIAQRRPDGAADLGGHRRSRRHRDRSEPRTRPGHLGDARRTAALRRVEGDVLGRGRPWRAPRASRRDDTERAERWQKAADEIKAEVLHEGRRRPRVFRQHYDTDALDASLLLIPIMGFLPPDDERVTRDRARDRRRAHQGRPRAALPGRSHRRRALAARRARSRSARSGWSRRSRSIGEIERARALFEKLLSFAGPLLLYAEEIDTTTGQHLGNYPQAFTHLALDRRRQPASSPLEPTDECRRHRTGRRGGRRFRWTARVPLPRARRGGRGHAHRPAQPPSLPTAALPGGDGHPASRPDRAGAASRAAQPSERRGRARRGHRLRPRPPGRPRDPRPRTCRSRCPTTA